MSQERKDHLDFRAVAVLLVCCGVWGLAQVAIKLTLVEIAPLWQSALRSAGATLLLLLWMRARRIPLALGAGTGRAGLLAGLLFAAEFACIFIGMQYTSASRMVVFLYTAPFVVALGMPLIAHNERLSAVQAAGLAAAFAGVLWAFAEGFGAGVAGSRQWIGDSLGVAAALLWGATTLVLRGTSLGQAAPEKALLYQLGVSALALGAAAWAAGEPWPAAASAATLWLLSFQTVVVTFASYLAWFWLVRNYPATRLAAFTLLTPVLGLVAGVLLLQEPLTMRLVVALAAVCGGIVLVNRGPRRPALLMKESGS